MLIWLALQGATVGDATDPQGETHHAAVCWRAENICQATYSGTGGHHYFTPQNDEKGMRP